MRVCLLYCVDALVSYVRRLVSRVCGASCRALGALGVQLAASFAGCVTLRSDTGTRLGRIGLPAGSQARSP
jgi:hypothetical protein